MNLIKIKQTLELDECFILKAKLLIYTNNFKKLLELIQLKYTLSKEDCQLLLHNSQFIIESNIKSYTYNLTVDTILEKIIELDSESHRHK